MTHDELKAALVPIVTDLALTKSDRDDLMLPLMLEILDDVGEGNVTEKMDLWNSVMAEIAAEHGLTRH